MQHFSNGRSVAWDWTAFTEYTTWFYREPELPLLANVVPPASVNEWLFSWFLWLLMKYIYMHLKTSIILPSMHEMDLSACMFSPCLPNSSYRSKAEENVCCSWAMVMQRIFLHATRLKQTCSVIFPHFYSSIVSSVEHCQNYKSWGWHQQKHIQWAKLTGPERRRRLWFSSVLYFCNQKTHVNLPAYTPG